MAREKKTEESNKSRDAISKPFARKECEWKEFFFSQNQTLSHIFARNLTWKI